MAPGQRRPTLGATPGSIKRRLAAKSSNVKRDVAAVRQEFLWPQQTQGETRMPALSAQQAPRVADGEKARLPTAKRGAYSGRATKTGGIPAPRWMLIGSALSLPRPPPLSLWRSGLPGRYPALAVASARSEEVTLRNQPRSNPRPTEVTTAAPAGA